MNPLGTVALGLLLALVDFRIVGVDVFADAVGWVVAVVGLSRLVEVDRRFGATRWAALVAGVLSLADLVHPRRTTTTGGDSRTAVVPPDGLQGVLVGAYSVAMVVVVVLLCLALRRRARENEEPDLAARFGLLAVLQAVFGAVALVLTVLALALGADGRITPQGPVVALTLVFVLAGLALQVWFLVTLAGVRTRPWLQPTASPAG